MTPSEFAVRVELPPAFAAGLEGRLAGAVGAGGFGESEGGLTLAPPRSSGRFASSRTREKKASAASSSKTCRTRPSTRFAAEPPPGRELNPRPVNPSRCPGDVEEIIETDPQKNRARHSPLTVNYSLAARKNGRISHRDAESAEKKQKNLFSVVLCALCVSAAAFSSLVAAGGRAGAKVNDGNWAW